MEQKMIERLEYKNNFFCILQMFHFVVPKYFWAHYVID
jgi:hypothetical protein